MARSKVLDFIIFSFEENLFVRRITILIFYVAAILKRF